MSSQHATVSADAADVAAAAGGMRARPPAHATSSTTANSTSATTVTTKGSAATTAPTASAPAPSPVARRPAFPRRVLDAYLRQLSRRPLRTKMLTSAMLFFMGDTMAQFGIEGRRLPWMPRPDDGAAGSAEESSKSSSSSSAATASDKDEVWDPLRCARLMFYGCFMFAPLAHNWINLLERVKFAGRWKTLAARVTLDQAIWGPFIVGMFWGANGILEGKSPAEVKQKVEMAFVPVYTKSVMVFGPTAIINFAFVPLQHRLLVGQSVGLVWNTYMSYLNHLNNKRLAAASAALSSAEAEAGHESDAAHTAEVERRRRALEAAQARKEKFLKAQGGGATAVGTRMGPG